MRGIAFAAENWRRPGCLFRPNICAQTGRLVAAGRSGLQYRLISNWAINAKNRPMTDFERAGLTEILVNPDQPYTAARPRRNAPVFQAILCRQSRIPSCIGCHNAHPNSPKISKTQDVIGGILLTIPLPQ